jgi:hypothetical protein
MPQAQLQACSRKSNKRPFASFKLQVTSSKKRQEAQVAIGADSPFFALLGSAPQELNTTRPEAKLEC